MKKYVIIFISIIGLLGCKKEPNPTTSISAAALEAKQKAEACYNDKILPNSKVGFAYVEGEIDGKKFRITAGEDRFITSQNATDFFNEYDSKYLEMEKEGKTWWGIGYNFIPLDDNLPNLSIDKNFYFQLQFPYFRGDSSKYFKYLSQFDEIGKSFPIGEMPDDKEFLKKIESNFNLRIQLRGCDVKPFESSPLYFLSAGGSQKDGYFRLVDVKKFKNGNTVYRRDLTFEFEVNLYSNFLAEPYKRIKNGKIVMVL